MPEPTPFDPAERMMAELRAAINAGPTSLKQAATILHTTEPDLMAAMLVGELAKTPGTVAIVTGSDGAVIVKRAGDGELSVQASTVLVQIFLAALFQNDPAARAAVCTPLPIGAGSTEVQ